MIDKALAGLNQGESYYFQLYPLSLTIIGEGSTIPAPGTTYRFTIFKGQQKFDETKLPIEANYKNINGTNLMVMPKCPINFYTPTFNKNRKTEFQFQMYQYEESNEYFIADYIIDIEPYITEYKNSRIVRFEHKSKFSEDYELEFEIYIEKSRFGLEKVVKDYKHERSLKSPLRQRKQPSPSKRTSPSKKNLTNEQPVKGSRVQGSNQSSKIQREEVTEISQSRNKKVEESQRSLKDQSKKVSIRNSRNNNSVIQPTREEQEIPKETARVPSSIQQSAEPIKKEESKIKQRSVNNYSQKQRSETSSVNKVPIVATRFKPLAKEDTPNQVKMKESQRLGSADSSQEKTVEFPKKQVSNTKQQILLILFMLVSFFLMYQSMHPNRRV